jgi:AraC family transcriptional regulator
MGIEVTVKKTEPMVAAYISRKGPYSQISESFARLYGWIGERSYIPAGPPHGVYFNAPGQVPESELQWELGSPLAGDIEPMGPDDQGLGVKRVEALEVAAAMHKGPFDKVGDTWGQLVGWIMENGYEIVGPGSEVYLSDPDNTPPEDLLTEVRFPVKKK